MSMRLILLSLYLGYVPSASAADVVVGQALYAANCTACHGATADGKGPAAVALKPKPTNLTDPLWWTGKTDEQVIAAIKAGRPGTSMTPFTQLSDADLTNVVGFLRTLAPAP